MEENRDIKKSIKIDYENYLQTVNALLSFSAFVVHDGTSERPNANFGFGRRMTKKSSEGESNNQDITPDLIAQKSNEYGIVAEIKRSLNKEQIYWESILKQLRKYDDELDGWFTDIEKIYLSDATLLIHHTISRRFKTYIEETKKVKPELFGDSSSLIEFSQSDEASIYYFFRLEYGKLNDHELNESLLGGISIPLDRVIESYSNIQYYDAKPPIVHILTQLWQDLFAQRYFQGSFDEEHEVIPLEVTVEDVTKELQEAYGSGALYKDRRSVEFPKKKWVKEALERLCEYKLAKHSMDEFGKYTILYKSFKNDVQQRFIDLEASILQKKEESTKQMELIDAEPE